MLADIVVIGAVQTKFGELWDKSLTDLLAEAQLKALDDAHIVPEDVDELFISNMCGESFSGQQHLGALSSQILGVSIPSIRIEGACASGALAVRFGIQALASGMAQVVMVCGVEKMSDVNAGTVTTSLMGASFQEVEQFSGATFPSMFACVARRYMKIHGLTREQLAHVSVKNHKNGVLNPDAHFQREVTVEHVMNASMIADPLTLLDCSPVSDGAACVILSTGEFAKHRNLNSIKVCASAVATDTLNLGWRDDIISFQATKKAGKKAFEMAGLAPSDIDMVELHDAFSMAEIIALEDLGFFESGQAGAATAKGLTALQGKLPVNPSGGLKAKGHPIGATGVGQVVEVVKQLRGACGKRQVKNVRTALTHSMGGIGGTVAVHIFQG